MPNETVWRMRFAAYTPQALVGFLLRTLPPPPDSANECAMDTTRWALEELERQLSAPDVASEPSPPSRPS